MAIQPKKHSMPVQQPEIRAYNLRKLRSDIQSKLPLPRLKDV